MARPLAVLGVRGGVGQATLRQLRRWRLAPLRLGSREPLEAWASGAAEVGEDVWAVDCEDPRALSGFIAGARAVINCAGPASRVGGKVVEAALSACVDVIDVNAMTAAQLAALSRRAPPSRVVVGCGMTPGLTGALALWASRSVDHARFIRILVGGRDHFTPAGAADVIEAAQRRLSQESGALGSLPPADVSRLFSAQAALAPYQDEESAHVARRRAARVDAWAVHEGRATQALLRWAMSQGDPIAAGERVARASTADSVGARRYQQIVVDVFSNEGSADDGSAPDARVRLRARGASELTGAALATAARGLIEGRGAAGSCSGADLLSEDWAVLSVRQCLAVLELEVSGVTERVDDALEEGVL